MEKKIFPNLNTFDKSTLKFYSFLKGQEIAEGKQPRAFIFLMLLKVSGSQNMKQKIDEICINFSQNTNERRYPEQLYRLGMFMF